MSLRSWRAALRIARRDAMRAKGRSALVLAMIALPVLGVAGADVVYRSGELEPREQAVRLMGSADGLLSSYGRGTIVLQPPNTEEGGWGAPPEEGKKPTAEQIRSAKTEPAALAKELLPAGTVLVPVPMSEHASATSKEGRLGVDTTEADLTDPLWRGKLNVVEGRAPGSAHEIAATRAFLDKSGLHLGDRTVLHGLDGTPFLITAVAEYPGELSAVTLVGRPGELVAPLRAANRGDDHENRFGGEKWLVRLPQGAVLDWPKVLELNKYGLGLASRTVLMDPPPRAQVPYYVDMDQHGYGGVDSVALVVVGTVVGMALLEIVLLAGPAFAVGARRSRRQLGLLAAGGGDRSHIRAVVLGGGLVLGVAGAVVGVVFATVLVAVLRPWAEEAAGQRFGHLDLQPLDLLCIALIGLVTGLLAAVVPAFQAARTDVVEALTGRGSVRPPSRRLAVIGLVTVAGGAALALLGGFTGNTGRTLGVLGGSALAELGMIACTPMLVGLFGRLGRQLPLSPRLALRDAVRHRGRTAPAVAAVMAAVAGSVAVGIYTASSDLEQRQQYRAELPAGSVRLAADQGPQFRPNDLSALQAAVERAVPDLGPRADPMATEYGTNCRQTGCGWVEVSVPKELRCPTRDPDVDTVAMDGAEIRRINREDPRCAEDPIYGSLAGYVAAGDATVLRNMFGVNDPAVEQALAAGKAVVFDSKLVKDGKITLDMTVELTQNNEDVLNTAPTGKPAVRHVTVDAVYVKPETAAAQALVSPQTAKKLGLSTRPAGSVWRPAAAPSDGAEQKASAAVAKLDDGASVTVERGYRSQQTLTGLALTGFAGLVALGAAGIATGLAAADSQRDLSTLAAVGATGGIRRRLSGFQCGVIAAMGTVLGTLCGVVPAVALRKMEASAVYDSSYGMTKPAEAVIAFPWTDLAITLVGLPMLAVLLAMLFTRSRLMLARRAA
ncbi:putative ABC transport system permease protein [Streptomyces sp. TLI_235]|nr:FtsX-like permease family protein [Streptomyces sp. TLI_235]PBC77930.1 putative ABC transport system permease protein [Streptomyces sp. TLI_235]